MDGLVGTSANKRLALYSTLYPGAEPFASDWYASVCRQTDSDFDLVIGLDELSAEDAQRALGFPVEARWMKAKPGSTPAQIRNRAFEKLSQEYDCLVLVDADDLLETTRVEAARSSLAHFDVAGCALQLMDQAGRDLGLVFSPPAQVPPEEMLVRHNVFGLSNSAYRSEVMRSCLPIPADCVLIDWLLASRAWAGGARFGFDATPRMRYRQYSANTAGVVGPFSETQVLLAATRVLDHYRLLLQPGWFLPAERRAELQQASERARIFHDQMTVSVERRREYVHALNELERQYVWWWSVAHPDLESIWKN